MRIRQQAEWVERKVIERDRAGQMTRYRQVEMTTQVGTLTVREVDEEERLYTIWFRSPYMQIGPFPKLAEDMERAKLYSVTFITRLWREGLEFFGGKK